MTDERLPEHVEQFLVSSMSRRRLSPLATPPSEAARKSAARDSANEDRRQRRAQRLATPQGAAESARAAQIARDRGNTALRVLAWVLIALIFLLIAWFAAPILAARAAADAAIAPVMMLF